MTDLTVPRPSLWNRLIGRTALRFTVWDDSYAERVADLRQHPAIAADMDRDGPAWLEYQQHGGIVLVRGTERVCFALVGGEYVLVGFG